MANTLGASHDVFCIAAQMCICDVAAMFEVNTTHAVSFLDHSNDRCKIISRSTMNNSCNNFATSPDSCMHVQISATLTSTFFPH